jgi:hypothetical protein
MRPQVSHISMGMTACLGVHSSLKPRVMIALAGYVGCCPVHDLAASSGCCALQQLTALGLRGNGWEWWCNIKFLWQTGS